MERFKNKNVILPHDFVQFIRRNYERIEEIEKKVEQFQNDPWQTNAYHSFRNLQFHKLFESVDSCFSEGDISKVISANIKPKLKRLDAVEDRIQVGTEYLESLEEQESFEKRDSENYDNIMKKFPLISIIKNNTNDKKSEPCPNPFLLVQGVHLTFSERQRQIDNLYQGYAKRFHLKVSNKSSKKQIGSKKKKLNRQESTTTRFIKSLRIEVPLEEENGESWASGESHFDDEEDKEVQYSNLQLTLPPLHSSVLTLLGQRSGPKPSPRSLLSLAQEPSISSGASRHKKLRRHGRNRHKNPKVKVEDDLNPGERAGSEEVKKTTTDEPHETQVSALPDPNDDQADVDSEHVVGDLDETTKKLQKFSESRRALYHVLDDHLAGKSWDLKEMSNLDEEIGRLVEDFRKYQTKFKTNLIKMKEDYWLAFPRTWSRSSATFGVPYDTRSLKGMTSLDYLERFVTISEPRRHLYSLIFQRHRMITNPTGKHITLKTCKIALAEVLGRPFQEEEMKQLCEDYLGCIDTDVPILEKTFHGIGAFCERIYSCYSLEEHHECHVCHNNPTKDRQRCHQDQKSHIEKADLTYLSMKVREGQVQKYLGNLLTALCDRD